LKRGGERGSGKFPSNRARGRGLLGVHGGEISVDYRVKARLSGDFDGGGKKGLNFSDGWIWKGRRAISAGLGRKRLMLNLKENWMERVGTRRGGRGPKNCNSTTRTVGRTTARGGIVSRVQGFSRGEKMNRSYGQSGEPQLLGEG